jgi:hypothetical protein
MWVAILKRLIIAEHVCRNLAGTYLCRTYVAILKRPIIAEHVGGNLEEADHSRTCGWQS